MLLSKLAAVTYRRQTHITSLMLIVILYNLTLIKFSDQKIANVLWKISNSMNIWRRLIVPILKPANSLEAQNAAAWNVINILVCQI